MEPTSWNDVSPNQEEISIFAVQIRSLTFAVIDIPFARQRRPAQFFFPDGKEIIWSEIITPQHGNALVDQYLAAQREAAKLFWQEQLVYHCHQQTIPYNRGLIGDLALEALNYFGPPWLPPVLEMEVDLLLPQTTREHTWSRRRSSIFKLKPRENRNHRP